uniref:glutathione transferase n=1 Tax=Noctiluca scintillans TaxID=2966 RepID=A0A7S0ZZ28_NOCSC
MAQVLLALTRTQSSKQDLMEGKLTVGYWHIRGLAAPLRMMCVYSGVPFENATYIVNGEPGSWDTSAWLKDAKPALKAKNSLMNLPYVIDGDVVVTQSQACLQYLARKLGLYGEGVVENANVDQISSEVMDLRNGAVGVFYGGGLDKFYENTVPVSYGKFESWLEQQGTVYTVGPKPTAGDFHLWEMLDQHEMCAKDQGFASPIANFPRLQALYEAFRKEPTLESYFNGDMYKLSVNNKMAVWGA